MWGAPDGWMPLKMRGRGVSAGLGDGAGASSVVIERECSRPPSPLDHLGGAPPSATIPPMPSPVRCQR